MNPSAILELHQVRKTAPRIAIVAVLQKHTNPLSEAEIKQEMGDLYDRITFYRNVQTLVEAGVLHRIVIGTMYAKYALNDCEEGHCHHQKHLHFYCKKCHEVICLEAVDLKPKVPEGFDTDEIEILMQGTCKRCKSEEEK